MWWNILTTNKNTFLILSWLSSSPFLSHTLGFIKLFTDWVLLLVYIYIYIYICIYIYHQQTGSFVVSKLFSLARHARCFKLGSKPGWLYVGWISYPRDIVIIGVSEGFFCAYVKIYTQKITYIYAKGVLISCNELCIYALAAAGNSSLECSTQWQGIYIAIHRQTVT